MKKTEIVFVGGGHTHVLSLLRLANRWPIGTTVTLVSDSSKVAYSGMLPGYISGQFRREECFIDLPTLCANTGVRWVEAAAVSISAEQGQLLLAGGDEIRFDLLSINVGGVPRQTFNTPAATTVKPAQDFLHWLNRLTANKPQTIAIIGAGAGGVELALALNSYFGNSNNIALIGNSLLPSANNGVRHKVRKVLQVRGITLFESTAISYKDESIILADGRQTTAQYLVYATPVRALAWLANSDLALNDNGFVQVNACLQSISHPQVFAAGDCAAISAPKSGVTAIRQSPTLSDNILAAINGMPLSSWHFQQRQLYILNTADGRAIAGWGSWYADGTWLWHWKKWLDKRFMNLFLPPSS
ncbi:FAD-dependent oxidoreductase [Candidatus Persebacteraceae bacterium Df01]|jgi:selenide,water dikinase|uniref:FAD-dependent oxidoreductase n=1 Tax=Candidatus Doriopsillibacter californiensis TaxID=2970740 RepID=A0ABT7QMQ6_9GAMM|nr:FAD-dependent oxidoreductase [Candidatus Persebacteraceae bacterium Df01]